MVSSRLGDRSRKLRAHRLSCKHEAERVGWKWYKASYLRACSQGQCFLQKEGGMFRLYHLNIPKQYHSWGTEGLSLETLGDSSRSICHTIPGTQLRVWETLLAVTRVTVDQRRQGVSRI